MRRRKNDLISPSSSVWSRRAFLRWIGAWTAAASVAGCELEMLEEEIFDSDATEPIFRAASFNIRFLDLTARAVHAPRGLAAWEARRQSVVAALRQIDADVVAFQEMETWTGMPQAGPPVQRDWLQAQMPGYGVAASAGRDGRESGQPIFFRRARHELLSEGVADLVNAEGDTGAFAGYAGLVTWARFRDRIAGRNLTAINLHLHFRDVGWQMAGAQRGRQLAAEAMDRGDDVVVLGDLNAGAFSRPVLHLRSGRLARVPSEGASFHFNGGLDLYSAIDHIFFSPGLDPVSHAQFLRAHFGGIYPSDHYPIWVDFELE